MRTAGRQGCGQVRENLLSASSATNNLAPARLRRHLVTGAAELYRTEPALARNRAYAQAGADAQDAGVGLSPR